MIAFHLKCLPEEWQQRIPRSTRHDWKQKDMTALFGNDWYMQNRHVFDTLQQVASSRRLLRANRALLQVIALKRFIQKYHHRIKQKMSDTQKVVLVRLEKIAGVMGVKASLKYLELSYSWYLELRKLRCRTSVLNRCYPKHPAQLREREIEIIDQYCKDERFAYWPRASVYHQIIRDGAAAFTISTFYKYVSLLGLQGRIAGKRRKNHATGIRAKAPLQIIHADITLFTTVDTRKNHIYLVEDNFSRAILQHAIAKERRAQVTFDNLNKVYENYLRPAAFESCELITDDGSENYGPVKDLIASSSYPTIRHLIAQVDIAFSNSMIEAANKQLKHRFLYYRQIADFDALVQHVQQAVDDYNNRPHNSLGGLTPLEVLHGKTVDTIFLRDQIAAAKATRLMENKKRKCCGYSF
jgi:hypothetical protein